MLTEDDVFYEKNNNNNKQMASKESKKNDSDESVEEIPTTGSSIRRQNRWRVEVEERLCTLEIGLAALQKSSKAKKAKEATMHQEELEKADKNRRPDSSVETE